MITKERPGWLRNEGSRGPLTGAEVGELLDAAESALELAEQVERYKKSIAITDKNFRVLQAERDALRTKMHDATERLEHLVEVADESDGIAGWHRNGALLNWEEFGIEYDRSVLGDRK